jgi:hypothetical protein
MHELTALKRAGSLMDTLLADYGLFHLEADLHWIDTTTAGPGELAALLTRERPPAPRKVTLPLLKRMTGADNARFE